MNRPHQAVYHLAPDGRVTRLITDAGKSNGVQVSPDQKTRTGVVARETHTSWPPASPESTGAGAAPVDGERGPARERYASSGPDEKTR